MCKDSKEYKNRLMDIVNDGMQEKYGDGFITDLWDRISDELLNHIIPDGKSRLFLMMYDAANYCRENGIGFQPDFCNEGMMCAFVLNIGLVNPMKPHYRCDCGYYEPAPEAKDGFDLPLKDCPYCGKTVRGDGHDIDYYNLNPKKEYCISVSIDYSRKEEILKFLSEKYQEVTFAKVAFFSDNGYSPIDYQYAPADYADDIIIAGGEKCVKEDIAFSKYGVLSFHDFENAFNYMKELTDSTKLRRIYQKLRYKKSRYSSRLGDLYPMLADFSFFSEFEKCYSLFWLFETPAFIDYKNEVINGEIPIEKIPTCTEELIEMLVSCGLEKSRVESAIAARRDPYSYAEDIEPGDEYIEKYFLNGLVPEYLLCLYKNCRFMDMKSMAIGKAMYVTAYFLAEEKINQ